jgi:thiol-disulfide isomerase/thioredoxin
MGKGNKGLVLKFFLVCFGITALGYPADAEVTQAELDKFRLTIHDGNEVFPFGNLMTLEGKPFDRLIIKGRYALITLWSTWCPYCNKENPSIQALYEKYRGEAFTVMTISLGEDGGTVRGYMDKEGYTFPVILDKEEWLKEKYAPKRPRSYIIDREGRIIAEIRGGKDWASDIAIRVLRHIIPGFSEGERR